MPPPLVGTEYWTTLTPSNTTITSATLSIKAGDLVITGMIWSDNSITNVAISNSGSALGWLQFANAGAGSNCRVTCWVAIAQEDGDRTVTVTWTTAEYAAIWNFVVPRGLWNTRDPIPAAKVTSGTGGNDVSQAVVPPIAGSMLWMLLGDWQGGNALDPNANCTRTQNFNVPPTALTAAVIRPTTNPRQDVSSFTIGEVADAVGETTAWVVFAIMPAIEDLTEHPLKPAQFVCDAGFPSELAISTW